MEILESLKNIELSISELKIMNLELEKKIDILIESQSKSNECITSHITFIETLYSQIKKPFHFIMSLPFGGGMVNSVCKNKLIGNK